MGELLEALHQPHAQLLLRLVLGGLLLLAGVSKLAGRSSVYEAVAEYDVLPKRILRPFAALLPWAEISLGTLLLLGFGTTVAAALAAPLFLSFAIAIGVNLSRGRNFDCHCFGSVQQERIGWPALLRSAALVLAALVVAVGTSRFGALEAALFGSSAELPSAAEVIPIVFIAAVIFDVLILLPEAAAFQRVLNQVRSLGMAAPRSNGHRPAEARVEVQGS